MNKRIQEILLSVVSMSGEDGELLPSLITQDQINEFALAIINVTSIIAWRNTPDYEELDYGHLISDKIKSHFGVNNE